MTNTFWEGKKVFLTGHTGFKGGWLSLWLQSMGAELFGYSLKPNTSPSLFEVANVEESMESFFGDIRDIDTLKAKVIAFQPQIIIHMAAQPLVRLSYESPIDTYETNVMGTANILECARNVKSLKAFLNITSDKCYENKEWHWGYRETDQLGGYDPYSSSKACSELITAAYMNSYFNKDEYNIHGVGIATARAGNVIGGGDWANDRLIPDFIRSIATNKKLSIRSPYSIRPWQHVMEPLSGYITLVEYLYADGREYSGAWNFGPHDNEVRNVKWIAEKIYMLWGVKQEIDYGDNEEIPHEAKNLMLDCSKSKTILGWSPRLNLELALKNIYNWHDAYDNKKNMKIVTLNQINDYQKILKNKL
jgi:CDP-glucose 4,6-dehydratase